MTTTRSNIEALLDHQDWVRALARSLVADPSRADDVAQQTMLEAMTSPPRDLSRPKGWLARVAKNAARALARQDSRRQRREQAVARVQVTHASPAEIAERATAHRQLVEQLFALEEPYHTVLLLRFFDDLDASKIAERLERPIATVRTQLQRGLDRMRERLDRQFGDRNAWCTALLPLFAARTGVTSVPVLVTFGALIMSKWVLPVLFVLVALFVGFYGLWAGPEEATPGPGTSGRVAAASASDAPAADVDEERRVVASPPTPSPRPEAAVGDHELRGRVVTVDGDPVPGLELAYVDPMLPRLEGTVLVVGNTSVDLAQPALREVLTSEEGIEFFAREYGPHADYAAALIRGEKGELPRTVTDSFGQFELAGGEDPARIQVEASDWLVYGIGFLPDSEEPVVVVGPAVQASGWVVDEQAVPIEDAYVSFSFSLDALPGIGQRLERCGYRSRSETTGADGKFDLGRVPAHRELRVLAQKRGYQHAELATSEVTAPVTLELEKEREAPTILSGRVLHADRSPAADAYVNFGQDWGQADSAGQFEFRLTYFSDDILLTAHLPGFQPAVVDGLGERLKQDASAGRDLSLMLGEAALSISGRVVCGSGEPCVGLRVTLCDGTLHGSTYSNLESAIGGQDSKGELTDRDGRFLLRGLSDREYTVRAMDEATLLTIKSEPIPAGTEDLVLTVPEDPFLPRLEGEVVDRFGNPVVGATVRVMARLLQGRHGATLGFRDRPGITDEDGRFVLVDCPRRHVRLAIGGKGIKDHEIAVPTELAPVRIEVIRLLKFTIRGRPKLEADRFVVRDENGQRLFHTVYEPNVIRGSDVSRIPTDASPVFEVDDRAVELVLMADTKPVRTVPLTLRIGELNRIDL